MHRLPAGSAELPPAAGPNLAPAKARAAAACRWPKHHIHVEPSTQCADDLLLHAAPGALPLAADLGIALAKAVAQDPELLLAALPPSAAKLEAWAQQGADVAAAEDAALAWQRLLPALQAASGSPLSAMAQALFQVRLCLWIAERTACPAPGLSPLLTTCLSNNSYIVMLLHWLLPNPSTVCPQESALIGRRRLK